MALTTNKRSIWIGFDPRESAAFAACRESISRLLTQPIPIRGLVLADLQAKGLYTRPIERRLAQMWDTISGAPMATEFACSRFLVPHLANTGWALFMDCDMLVRTNLSRVFDIADDSKAVMCVKHEHSPAAAKKMDGQLQTLYRRKNWSSFMLFNCDHPANQALTLEMVNTVPGRDLHRFFWLKDADIGELDVSWNWLVGHSTTAIEPKVVHFTDGGPWFTGFENVPYADEWRNVFHQWAA